jgi:hypothetical protein
VDGGVGVMGVCPVGLRRGGRYNRSM